MTTADVLPLSALYERDETAWLETMSALAAEGRYTDMDFPNLSEYLADMAKRDRREVFSRLVTLISHLLKWDYQADRRSRSWLGTILEQQRELRQLLESGTLHNHAVAVLAKAYAEGCKQALAETGLARETFPVECGWDVEALLLDRSQDAGGNKDLPDK
jgi:hypothetical protein